MRRKSDVGWPEVPIGVGPVGSVGSERCVGGVALAVRVVEPAGWGGTPAS